MGHSMRSTLCPANRRQTPEAESGAGPVRRCSTSLSAEGPLTAAEVEAATRRFKKAIIERALGRRAEPSSRLSAGRRQARRDDQSSQRHSGKTVLTDDGPAADRRAARSRRARSSRS